jgi:hypothetical protein
MINITTGSNNVVIGNNNATNAYVKVAWTVTSDARDKTCILCSSSWIMFCKSIKSSFF